MYRIFVHEESAVIIIIFAELENLFGEAALDSTSETFELWFLTLRLWVRMKKLEALLHHTLVL